MPLFLQISIRFVNCSDSEYFSFFILFNWWLLLLFAESCGAGEEGQTTCSKCSAGYYKPSAGLVPCMKCPQQYTSNEDRTQCNICKYYC
jgi:hypothetical protein